MPFSWQTFAQGKTALAARLADPGQIFWTDSELGLYIAEALRTHNALTEQWNDTFAFSISTASQWYNLGTLAGSPRLRTLTDGYLYTEMQFHLLEPPSGGNPWSGTSQFSLQDLQYALQRSRDEAIQIAGCNLQNLPPLPSTPNTRRTFFNDSTLEPRRARFVPDSGSAFTLTREDTAAWDAFEPGHLQQTGTPQAYSIVTGPPLAMDVDIAPDSPGTYDVISLQSGPVFAPPALTLLGVPDDWAYVAKFGALADLLGRESEATDIPRAAYCAKRYLGMLEAMRTANWLISATLNGLVVDTPSVREQDGYSPEWQGDSSAWPALVTAGTDLCAASPGGTAFGCSVVLIGNQPVPVNDSDYIQISRDAWDPVLDEAQFLAAFKQGGAEFEQAKQLDQNFLQFCVETNKRLAALALFRDLLGIQGERQNIVQPR